MFNLSNLLGALQNGGNEGGRATKERRGSVKVLGSTAILLPKKNQNYNPTNCLNYSYELKYNIN